MNLIREKLENEPGFTKIFLLAMSTCVINQN